MPRSRGGPSPSCLPPIVIGRGTSGVGFTCTSNWAHSLPVGVRALRMLLMTIAKRLVLLLSVPLLALVGLGAFTLWQLTTIETPSRFVAETKVPSPATLGNISRAFAELGVHLRNHVLATNEAERARVRSAFDRAEAALGGLVYA